MSSFSHLTEGDPQWSAASGRPFQQFDPSPAGEVTSIVPSHNVGTPASTARDWSDTSAKRSFANIVHPENIEGSRSNQKPGVESPLESQGVDSENEDDPEEKHRESKRPRMAISCSECRRRKIKCDRNVPCMACVKRGVPGSCKWENAKVEPSPQPFALKTQVDELQKRLDSLQETLQFLPSEIVKAVTVAQQQSSVTSSQVKRSVDQPDVANTSSGETHLPTKESENNKKLPVTSRPSLNTSNLTSSAAPTNGRSKELTDFYDDAAENAAVVLESIAFNPQAAEGGGSNDSMISHEYWRGNMLTPVSGAALAGNAKNDPRRSYSQRQQQNQEYTTALTSIMAPSLDVALDRFNPVLMQQRGPEPDTPQQLLKNRFDAMSSILENLPTARQSYYLIEQYKNIIHWRSRVLHWPSFQAELNYFWEMMSQQRQNELDPLWIAVFYMVMALALDNRSTAPTGPNHPFHGYTHQRLNELTSKLHAVSMKALYLGDAMSTPRVRTIQAVILFNQFFQSSSAWRKADMMLHWNALAIRTAQLMGLHRLGNNPETMPPDDPAWPPGKNAVKRYMALRVWMMLQWADWMSASARFRCYTIQPDQCTSQVVDNVNDWELSPTEWRYTPQPPHVVTSSSFEVYKWNIANMLRQTFDKLITYADRFSYSTVLELDAGYRKILENLPEAFQRESPAVDRSDPKVRRQRNIALEGIHSRIVRLNRPFLSRAYSKGSKFAYSRENCLHSARIVIDCHYNLRDLTTSGSLWFVYSHTLSAAMVLFLDLFWSIDHNLPPAEVDEKTRTIFMVGEIFSMYSEISNTPLRRIVESAFRIISELISESQSRRSAMEARNFNMSSPQQPFMKPPPFSEVLRRISRNMTLSNNSSRLADSGSTAMMASQLPSSSYQQSPYAGGASAKTYEQPPLQDFLSSGFYNALGVQDESDPTFSNLWNLNTSPESQSDLSFLNAYPGAGPDVGDRYGLWHFFVGQDVL
ncbi:uncharacterized protein N7483_004839 [Penicillium malachiteum]|uniref:uncharacterized protein n=1 Tax=Penicillium malachiteum TaxID=1324776 RepID=UPI002546A530|nr:uncharacterized protein N7483_004839 [Penicillium malachiteum]KAJ5730331.1 hypothetical protein N7483_004839 [Penicillium malachiteum]